ncbi:endonuclease [Desulfococcaceae bacterium HSG8]|nr:endonuclease [Desulfococcaceae bacterium HSG8]
MTEFIKKGIGYCFFIIIPVFFLAGCSSEKGGSLGNTKYESFTTVKKLLLSKVYDTRKRTFYCDCPFTADKHVGSSKKFKPKKKSARSSRIEWEHIVPAHAFGSTFKAWHKTYRPWKCWLSFLPWVKCRSVKGRENARRASVEYRYMESDMYNLVPAIGEVNQARSNYPFRIIRGEKREYGPCDIEISDRKAEPAPRIRGTLPGHISIWTGHIRVGKLSNQKKKRCSINGTGLILSRNRSASGVGKLKPYRVIRILL